MFYECLKLIGYFPISIRHRLSTRFNGKISKVFNFYRGLGFKDGGRPECHTEGVGPSECCGGPLWEEIWAGDTRQEAGGSPSISAVASSLVPPADPRPLLLPRRCTFLKILVGGIIPVNWRQRERVATPEPFNQNIWRPYRNGSPFHPFSRRLHQLRHNGLIYIVPTSLPPML